MYDLVQNKVIIEKVQTGLYPLAMERKFYRIFPSNTGLQTFEELDLENEFNTPLPLMQRSFTLDEFERELESVDENKEEE